MVTTTTYPMHDGSSMHGGVSSSFFAAYNEGKIIDGIEISLKSNQEN